ncbi:DNA-processing protein DprA [Bacillus sp. FJAT-45037]|uniref:DNA-processing protein DprA n=1 Tax=Bacillus sp. FJAT-45037 TaxID=2011007 RepID=UPI000C241CE5|nr:DNA-processing protein DprA [Bacillus sp. FJAT-45037]
MSTFRQRLIHVHGSSLLNWKNLHDLIRIDSTLSTLYHIKAPILSSLINIKEEKAQKLIAFLHKQEPASYEISLNQKNCYPLTRFDPSYPAQLTTLYDPPWVLYLKGDRRLLSHNKTIGIVGTRQPTTRGKRAVFTLVGDLVKEDFMIVSGLAIGIDACAHQQAISQKGKTIAVLGSGFDFPYPKQNNGLYDYMCQHQLVLTEYPPHQPPTKWTFPTRNRIISGLSQGILVIEAKSRSGSLITADQALEQNREVFAVPGPIDCENARGTNQLIQQGAKLTMAVSDILEEWT